MNNLGQTLNSYIISPLFILLLIGGFFGVVTFLHLLRFRQNKGVNYWLLWQIATSIWAFTYAFEYAATDLETKIFWSKLSYFGIVYAPVSFLLFSLDFSSRTAYLKWNYLIPLFIFSSIFILSPFTNDYHHLHWQSYSIDPETNATDYVYGPFFWVMTFFAYLALVGGIINIARLYLRSVELYKRQVAIVFICSVIPLFGNVIYIFQINPLPGFDWTPFSFLITGVLIAFNIVQFKMFKLVPIARNKVVDLIPDAMLVLDNSMRIADYNQSFKDLLSPEKKESLGLKIVDVLPYRENVIQQVQQYEKFEAVLSSDQNGKLRHFELQSVAIYDQKRVKIGWLIMLKDISERIIAEAEIKEANVRLIAEIKEKEKLIDDLDAFSHTVAHDLKSMLSAIVTASSLLKWGIDNMTKEEQLEVNDLISQSATKTMSITRELLTLASVRQQEIVPRPVNMLKLVQEALFRLKDIIAEKDVQISLPDNWINVMGYDSWIEEVWLNYISNAVKYGGSPAVIQIGCTALENNLVKYWIKDNGDGISPEEMETLFNKFTRLHKVKAEGHGLGLSIVKRIIDRLNGDLGVESKNIPSEGSTFYFILPQAF